ncbi:MAG: MFS transporter [Candidatus Bathyarchaeia archaeon]
MSRLKTLVLSSIDYLTLYLCRYNLPPVLPILMALYQMSHGDVGALASAGLVSYAIMLFPAGLLGDTIGPKRVIIIGNIISSLSNIAFSFSTLTTPLLGFSIGLVIQFLNGLGQGMVWGPLTRLVSDLYSKDSEAMGLAMSLLLLPANVGPTVAYVLSGYLAMDYSWRTSFLFPSFLLLVVTGIFWLSIKDPSNRHRIDSSKGSLVTRERIRLILFDRNVWLVALAYACYMGIFRGLLAWLPTYLTEKIHMSPFQASILGGLSTLTGAGSMFIGAWLTGVEFKRRFKFAMAISFALSAPALWILPYTVEENMVLVMFSLIFAFLGFGGSIYFTYSPIFLPKEAVGTASGFIDGVAYIGGFVGVLAIGIAYDVFLSYAPAFAFLTLMAGSGMVIALLI